MRIKNVWLPFTLLLLVLAGCAMFDKSTHNAGKDCMWAGCHGYEASPWTYAGTAYEAADRAAAAKGVTVRITDSTGEIKLKTNSAGNFYTLEGNPAGGYTASIFARTETRTMRSQPTSGACNSCHAPDSQAAPLHTD